MTRTRNTYLGLLAVLLLPMAANADPITYVFDMPAFTAFALTGETSVLEVTVDNGGTSAANQSFLNTEIIGLFTDLTGAADTLYYSSFVQTVITTDAFGIATMNFAPGGNDLWVVGLGPGDTAIQLRNRPYEYYVRLADGTDGLNSDPFPILSRPVPEPGTLALLGIGLAGVVLTRRRRKV